MKEVKPLNINQVVGLHIRQLRALLKESGATFGQRLEPYLGEAWSRQTVWDAENGKRDFRIEELMALAQAAKVPVQWFFLKAPKRTPIKWKSGAAVTGAVLTNLLRTAGEPSSKREEVLAARRLLREAQVGLRNADEYLKFIGDPEDAEK